MFYYRPTLEHAYNDILALRDVTTLGILRELHRWGAHAMVIAVWLHMYRVFLTGSYKPPREFNWGVGVILLVLTLVAVVHRLSAALGPACDLGDHGRLEHGTGDAGAGSRGPWCVALEAQRREPDHVGLGREVRAPGRAERGRDDAQPVLRSPLRGDPAGGRAPDHDPLLAGPQGRRDQRADVIVVGKDKVGDRSIAWLPGVTVSPAGSGNDVSRRPPWLPTRSLSLGRASSF